MVKLQIFADLCELSKRKMVEEELL